MRSMTTFRTMRGAAALAAVAAAALSAHAGAAEPAPTVATGGVTSVKGTSGLLQGNVTPNGIAVSYAFEYGPNAELPPATFPNKTKLTPVPLPVAPARKVRVGQTVTGLLPGYHFRIIGVYTDKAGVQHQIDGKESIFRSTTALKLTTAKGRDARVSAVYGGSAELTGTLSGTGNAHHGLTLQETPYPFTAAFTTLPGTVLTNTVGGFTFRVTNLTQNTQFRFVTVDTRPIIGPTVVVHVTPRISLHVRRGGTTSLYRLYGTVSPARNGSRVTIQQLLPQKATSNKEGPRAHAVGSTVLKRRSATSSRFSMIVKLSGSYRYRAFVRLTAGSLESGHSSNVLVKAPAAPTRTTKK